MDLVQNQFDLPFGKCLRLLATAVAAAKLLRCPLTTGELSLLGAELAFL